ncbi:hypothetical protein C4U88_09290, partial [Clostridioides difficile]|nr:hypothetical protein [Clostridioides difficile]MDB0407769.1 hypothetical protein [Clostridioides difficile]
KISFTALFIVSSNSFLTVSSTKPLSSISTSASFIILFKSIILFPSLFSFLRVTKHFNNNLYQKTFCNSLNCFN